MITESSYLSQQVKEARGNQSLRQFSQKCKISHAHLAKIERGLSRGKPFSVSVHILAKLINSGVEIDYNYLISVSLKSKM